MKRRQVDKVPRRVKQLTKQVRKLRDEILTAWEESYLVCEHCGKRQKMKHSDLICDYYYVEPYSCSGGDYWTLDREYWECNKCGHQVNPMPDGAMGWRERKSFHQDKPEDKSESGQRRKLFNQMMKGW